MWRRARADEEGRRVWDLFDRETAGEPPRPVSDQERDAEVPEPTAREPEEAGAPR